MARFDSRRLPIIIDAQPVEVDPTMTLSQLVPTSTRSIVTHSGNIIPASKFQEIRAEDVSEGFDTQHATFNKAWDHALLMNAEVQQINFWLQGFGPNGRGQPCAFASPTREFIAISGFPLPDQFRPDFIDIVLYTELYPTVPPIGIYLLEADHTRSAIDAICRKLNVFQGNAFHGAESPLDGYRWVCFISQGWRVHPTDIRKGQNIQKYLAYFFATLCE